MYAYRELPRPAPSWIAGMARLGLLTALFWAVLPVGHGPMHNAQAAATASPSAATSGETLLRDSASNKIYLVYNGVKHWISNSSTFAAMGLSYSAVVTATAAQLKALATSTTLSERVVMGKPWPFALIAGGRPVLMANPPAASASAVVRLSGSSFGHSEPVQIRYSRGRGVLDVLSDANGHFSADVPLPSDEPLETMLIYAYGTHSGAFGVEPFTIIPVAPAATLTAAPPAVMPGGVALLSGSGFDGGEQVTIYYSYGRAVVTAKADAAGRFAGVPLVIPMTSPLGSQWTVAYGVSSKHTASLYLPVQQSVAAPATITLYPATASPGSLVQVSGSGFVANDSIKIALDHKTQVTVVANTAGSFSATGFTVSPTLTPGPHTLTATGKTGNRTASAVLTIAALTPHLAVSPANAIPGTQLALSGTGYAPDEQVTLALNGVALETVPHTVTTNAAGAFAATVQVPSSALSGANSVTAIGSRSRAAALATINVTLPVASTWYFAGADTNAGDDPQLALVNTHGVPAKVDITYMFAGGVPPMAATTTVAPHSRATVDAGAAVGAGRALFVKITADRTIGAELTLLRTGRDFGTMLGASSTHHTWYLAEGYTGLSFKETLHLLNPGNVAAKVHVRLLPFNGRAGVSVDVVVQPSSGLSLPVNSYLANQSLSAVVTADQGIVVARSQEFGPNGYGLTQQVGTNLPSLTWLFAEGSTANGFETYLTILNPSTTSIAAVTASFFDATGTPIGNKTILIEPLHRGNIKVNDVVHASGIATILTSNVPVVAERPLYFGPPNSGTVGGSDVFGRNGAGVRWLFPEGNTSAGFAQFLLLQNPGSSTAMVDATFYGLDGKTVTTHYSVPAKSRITVDVGKDVPGLAPAPNAVYLSAANGVPFVAEESLYSANFSQGDGTEGIAQ